MKEYVTEVENNVENGKFSFSKKKIISPSIYTTIAVN